MYPFTINWFVSHRIVELTWAFSTATLDTFSHFFIICRFSSSLLTFPPFFPNVYSQHLIMFVEKNWTRVSRVHTKNPAAIVEISALAPSPPQTDAWQLVDNTIMHAHLHWNYCEELNGIQQRNTCTAQTLAHLLMLTHTIEFSRYYNPQSICE